jgi:hypothetical protein
MLMLFFVLLLSQRLDITCVSHDHGPDVTKAVRLSCLHSFLCIDHELDLTVNAGIAAAPFCFAFAKASEIVSTVRSSTNLYRRVKDEQVRWLFLVFAHFYCYSAECFQLHLWTFESIPMCMLKSFSKTRWQSKYLMLDSVIRNKATIRVLCASDDEDCKSLHEKDMTDAEWRLLEVCLTLLSFLQS